jgi:hypothetical protein
MWSSSNNAPNGEKTCLRTEGIITKAFTRSTHLLHELNLPCTINDVVNNPTIVAAATRPDAAAGVRKSGLGSTRSAHLIVGPGIGSGRTKVLRVIE